MDIPSSVLVKRTRSLQAKVPELLAKHGPLIRCLPTHSHIQQ